KSLPDVLLLVIFPGVGGKPLSSREEKKTKLLLVSFDGFRWDYDRDVDTPHLDRMAWDGVKAKYVTPPMMTMTSPSHFTTITDNYHYDESFRGSKRSIRFGFNPGRAPN
uniref:Uncharacterized protein n=1 Tax=Poecilia mexicana TaxID=48701 RepID=A0A3B3Y845_9TELE